MSVARSKARLERVLFGYLILRHSSYFAKFRRKEIGWKSCCAEGFAILFDGRARAVFQN